MEPLRVLIADDHPVFRDGLRALLTSIAGTEVVGEAADGVAAVEQSVALQPDVVVMDLDLPELDGVAATRQIVATSPHVGVLVLTMFGDDESVYTHYNWNHQVVGHSDGSYDWLYNDYVDSTLGLCYHLLSHHDAEAFETPW